MPFLYMLFFSAKNKQNVEMSLYCIICNVLWAFKPKGEYMKNYLLILTAFFTISIHSSVFAEDFNIGVEAIEYYPLYAKRDGQYNGYARALLDEFAKKEGHTFTYKILPIKRLFNSFVEGDVDFKFPDSPYWKKGLKAGKNVVYSDSAVEYIDGVLVSPKALGKGKEQLKTLGVLRGFTAWDYLDDISSKAIKLKEGNSLKSLVQMVSANRIDGVYFNVIVAKYFMENTLFAKDSLIFDKSLPHTRGNYYLSTIKHPKVLASFNKFLKENGALVESLKAKYNVNLF